MIIHAGLGWPADLRSLGLLGANATNVVYGGGTLPADAHHGPLPCPPEMIFNGRVSWAPARTVAGTVGVGQAGQGPGVAAPFVLGRVGLVQPVARALAGTTPLVGAQ